MDEQARDSAGSDPVPEITTNLRVLADRQLTEEQAADLDEILSELEALVRRGIGDPSTLARCKGDLKIIETAAEWADGTACLVPVSRAQRDRIKRLLPLLAPDRRRPRRWRRP
jgi:hypothetical protein